MGNLGAPNHQPHDPIQFEGYVKAMRTNERDGEMLLTVAVPPEYKFIALLTTDYPGTMFDLTFHRGDESFAVTLVVTEHEVSGKTGLVKLWAKSVGGPK